jgi:hypothetical protein
MSCLRALIVRAVAGSKTWYAPAAGCLRIAEPPSQFPSKGQRRQRHCRSNSHHLSSRFVRHLFEFFQTALSVWTSLASFRRAILTEATTACSMDRETTERVQRETRENLEILRRDFGRSHERGPREMSAIVACAWR